VVFVVDRSGSMGSAFGTSGRTRHAEAIDQLLRFLEQSGEDTRFTVALFSDEGVAWRTRLVPADGANLAAVRRWLEDRPPEGETRLFEGVRAGLALDPRGRLNPERCEADTVIVLCDGATTEGSGWVARWLAQENERAQLVFHCVQIGEGGNGTLEALAAGTGGQFVRVRG
jgi:Mg-chelatase subunit ChlD